MTSNILYIQRNNSTPFICTDSETLMNIASLSEVQDIRDYLAKGRFMCYFAEEVKLFIALLDRAGIDYAIEYQDRDWDGWKNFKKGDGYDA